VLFLDSLKLNQESVQRCWLEIYLDRCALHLLLPSVVFLNYGSKRRMASQVIAVKLKANRSSSKLRTSRSEGNFPPISAILRKTFEEGCRFEQTIGADINIGGPSKCRIFGRNSHLNEVDIVIQVRDFESYVHGINSMLAWRIARKTGITVTCLPDSPGWVFTQNTTFWD
jgi:hypothetical protein